MPVDERLKFARESLGLTLKQVEAATGIGPSSLSEYESGKRAPRVSQLKTLADFYRRSIAFFLTEGEIPREILLWRQRPADAAAAEIQGRFLGLCEQYHNLEVWCADRQPCRLPKAEGNAHSFRYRDAERLARQVRQALELGDRPGQSLLWVLEEVCGVKIFHLPFEETGSAACTLSETYGPAILLNSRAVRWRRNFDLAHELFHVLTWQVFRAGFTESDTTPSEQEEKLATCFAGNLLMPVDTVREAIEDRSKDASITFKDLFDIARQFDVSVESLFWRMKFLFDRSEEETRRDIERYQAVGRIWEVDRERDEPPPRPLRFRALAISALRAGKMSQGKFAEYLGISRREAMRFVEQEAPENEEVAIPPA